MRQHQRRDVKTTVSGHDTESRTVREKEREERERRERANKWELKHASPSQQRKILREN